MYRNLFPASEIRCDGQGNDSKCFARLSIFKNVALNQVQECKVDIKKNRVGEH